VLNKKWDGDIRDDPEMNRLLAQDISVFRPLESIEEDDDVLPY
jgi:hypothetical protein